MQQSSAGGIDNGSFWFDSLAADRRPDPAPTATDLPTHTDVAIIGAGYTGLWTAYYLNRAEPSLAITIIDANSVGFGASGRNGGWCMGWSMDIDKRLARGTGGLAVARAMQDTVDEIGRVSQAENIDCHYTKGGTLAVATTTLHADRFQRTIERRGQQGFDGDDFVWLAPAESRARLNAAANFGAMYTPHCARLHPGRLVHGLAHVLRERGITIIEHTPVTNIDNGRLTTTQGQISAPVILRATEGYTDSIAGQSRQMLPLYSMMITTEPLSDDQWQDIGLMNSETFGDGRRIVIYGQRTLDNRIAIGGRAGYYFGSKRLPVIPHDHPNLQYVEDSLFDLLPQLQGTPITHRWGGLMGVASHFRPSVQFDRTTGFGRAGGYTGEGVAASNLAARILADLTLGKATDITRLPWVDDIAPRWPIEPFRWLGAGTIQHIGLLADRAERRTSQPSLWGKVFDRLYG